MSLQWTVVATFLYAEVFLVLLLCVPFVSAARWQRIFRSRLVGLAVARGNTAFLVLIAVLVLLLLDALRETQRYGAPERPAPRGPRRQRARPHEALPRPAQPLRGRVLAAAGLPRAPAGDADLAAGRAGRRQRGVPQAGRGRQPRRPALHGGQRRAQEAAAGWGG
ncbi:hypothetical protein Q9966_016786 [Columba livia]|nr:hypothetical protein Q9966_016786 [Columba livia]